MAGTGLFVGDSGLLLGVGFVGDARLAVGATAAETCPSGAAAAFAGSAAAEISNATTGAGAEALADAETDPTVAGFLNKERGSLPGVVAPLLPDTAESPTTERRKRSTAEGPTKVRRKRSLKAWTRASSASKRSSSRNVALSPACSGGMHSKGDATSLLVKLWWISAMAVS
jgi:hypothetical protein